VKVRIQTLGTPRGEHSAEEGSHGATEVCLHFSGSDFFLRLWTQEPGSVEAVRTEGARRVGTLSGGATQVETHADHAIDRQAVAGDRRVGWKS
jgi:hypothetical protein